MLCIDSNHKLTGICFKKNYDIEYHNIIILQKSKNNSNYLQNKHEYINKISGYSGVVWKHLYYPGKGTVHMT